MDFAIIFTSGLGAAIGSAAISYFTQKSLLRSDLIYKSNKEVFNRLLKINMKFPIIKIPNFEQLEGKDYFVELASEWSEHEELYDCLIKLIKDNIDLYSEKEYMKWQSREVDIAKNDKSRIDELLRYHVTLRYMSESTINKIEVIGKKLRKIEKVPDFKKI